MEKTIFLVIILNAIRLHQAHAGLCDVENGLSSIILDIEESRDKSTNQQTKPSELPIVGEPNVDIFLDLIFPKGQPLFALNEKRLQLLAPVDRDEINGSHIVFQLTCTVKSTRKKRTLPVIVRLNDVNDNAPEFVNEPYVASISELTPLGTTIYQHILAKDKDAGVNGLVEYSIVPAANGQFSHEEGVGWNRIRSEDGYGFFAIHLPHQGQVTVNRTLDFEKTQRYYITIVASDRAKDEAQRLSSTTTLTVNIRDDDDQNPSFVYTGCTTLDGACVNPEYSASVSSGTVKGILNIHPEKIQAIDMDTLNAPIRYSFVNGAPDSYADYFKIIPETGAIQQINAVDTSTTKTFSILVKAEEVSQARRSATAKLSITVKPVDMYPPEIILSSLEGYVDENSPVGQKIVDSLGIPLKVSVMDSDFGPNDTLPSYSFELTTTRFSIDKNGYLVVNEFGLDRDPPSPSLYKFQIVAREKDGSAASTPVPVTVHLNDVNDNTPQLPLIAPITIVADEDRHHITKITATDNDSGVHAKITYSIHHVSNNGQNKFVIDSNTGDLEAVQKLKAGQQYSLTVQATDGGGLMTHAIVEVTVNPGPNKRSPVFEQSIYNIEVSEGASINSTLATITAVDPENDPVSYSIISGNDFKQFAIGPRSGVMMLIRQLDRELLSKYLLIVQAEDDGLLSSTATVNVKVTDINDKNPEFVGDSITFSIKEGVGDSLVGYVRATDTDEGINAIVTYSIPTNLPFSIHNETGEIRTVTSLDYETQKEYQFVVTAKDGAPDARIATATVTVSVLDLEDELPVFSVLEYTANVPENIPDHFVTDVVAIDPDTIKKITYVIHQGPTDLFRIDENTGSIHTTRSLDYEKESQHVLSIGTLENMSNGRNSTTKVIVNVLDRNDIPPVFTTIPLPISLDDNVEFHTAVINLTATDSDGTSPGNQVRYELIGRGKALKYFQIDTESGMLYVINDLKKEIDTEYQVDVRAYDLGDPQLASVITVEIYVRHVATVAPEEGLRFADNSYILHVPENATVGTKLKSLTIVNSKTHGASIPLKCYIISGNEQRKFSANVTSQRNCALYLNGSLDFESDESFEIEMQIMSLKGFINHEYANSQITINVVDINDNAPFFLFNEPISGKFYAAVDEFSPLHTPVIQIKAEDLDSGKFAKLHYSLNGSDAFAIDPLTGVVRTKTSLLGLRGHDLPFRLSVIVRDNPLSETDFHEIEAPLVVNIIRDVDRLVLVIGDATPEHVEMKLTAIKEVIREQSGFVVGVEKLSVREFVTSNGTLESDPTGTDVWFYVVDPESDRIATRNSTLVRRKILDKRAMDNITFDVTGRIMQTAFHIHEPLMVHKVKTATIASFNGEVFPYALIIIACIIFILGVVGVIYICLSWSRYKSFKDQMHRQYVVPSSPARYDTVYVEPNLKEYETQVLQMCVPVDEQDDFNDLHLDFSNKNHAFSLDNVSYISKDNNLSAKYMHQNGTDQGLANRLTGNGDATLGRNHSRSSDDEDANASHTNSNVHFKEKKDFSHLGFTYGGTHSLVETTTEL